MKSRLCLFVLTFVLGIALKANAQDPTFITVDFPNAGPPYITEATGINSQGDVVGIYATGGYPNTQFHSFLLKDGVYTSLLDLPGLAFGDQFSWGPRGILCRCERCVPWLCTEGGYR